jgi:hypothetical protein
MGLKGDVIALRCFGGLFAAVFSVLRWLGLVLRERQAVEFAAFPCFDPSSDFEFAAVNGRLTNHIRMFRQLFAKVAE